MLALCRCPPLAANPGLLRWSSMTQEPRHQHGARVSSSDGVKNSPIQLMLGIGSSRAESWLRYSGHAIRTRSTIAGDAGNVLPMLVWSAERMSRRARGIPHVSPDIAADHSKVWIVCECPERVH